MTIWLFTMLLIVPARAELSESIQIEQQQERLKDDTTLPPEEKEKAIALYDQADQ